MKKNTPLSFALKLIVLCSFTYSNVYAQEESHYSWLNITAGRVGIFDDSPKNSGRYGIEYRSAKRHTKWDIIPAFGYSWSVNGTKYIYSDLKRDWSFKNNYILTLSMGTGLFDNNKNIDLGHTLEFRTGIELSYKMKKGYRLGLAGYHLSNSRISSKNPGTESLVMSLLIPLNKNLH